MFRNIKKKTKKITIEKKVKNKKILAATISFFLLYPCISKSIDNFEK